MSIQVYKSQMPTKLTAFGFPQNLQDIVTLTGSGAAWSTGAMQIVPLGLVPPFTETWQIQNVSISALLALSVVQGPFAGKLGKIITGLTTITGPTNPVGFAPLTQPPSDQSLIAPLWDPASDPLPPVTNTATLTAFPLPVSAQVSPPVPITLDQSEPLSVGIWMLPALLAAANVGQAFLTVLSAQYTVIYDDGVTPPPAGYS